MFLNMRKPLLGINKLLKNKYHLFSIYFELEGGVGGWYFSLNWIQSLSRNVHEPCVCVSVCANAGPVPGGLETSGPRAHH